MKAIIVGGGIVGLATAWALARDGHEVELFEQGPLPNPLASSRTTVSSVTPMAIIAAMPG
jgi:glycine/D-amino acid oxidase-like deaminating enzyme